MNYSFSEVHYKNQKTVIRPEDYFDTKNSMSLLVKILRKGNFTGKTEKRRKTAIVRSKMSGILRDLFDLKLDVKCFHLTPRT